MSDPDWHTNGGDGPRGVGSGPLGAPDQVCSEEVFRSVLETEHKRAERSGRPVLLLLVDVRDRGRRAVRIDEPDTARQLFAGMARCLRETDVIGWYRQGRVAGAVLTELGCAAGWDAVRVVGPAVSARLTDSLPRPLAGRLRVRVYRYPETGDAEWRAHPATMPGPGRPRLVRRVALTIRGWVEGTVGFTSHTSGEPGC